MRICKEKPTSDGYYHCGNGRTINGVRYCSDYGIKAQLDYAGHLFCADIGEEQNENQLSLFDILNKGEQNGRYNDIPKDI